MPIPTFKDYVSFMKKRGNIAEVMIISSEDGALWASTNPDSFFLQEYKAMVAQEDGTDREETINEAHNILQYMKGAKPSQGLRICGKKQQVTRNFVDEKAGVQVICGKIPQGGCCIAHGGKCILIGTFDEKQGHTSPECNETITYMAMYLAKSDWPTGNEG